MLIYGNQALFNDVLNLFVYLPICANISNKFFCVNSGLDGNAMTLDSISAIDRFDDRDYYNNTLTPLQGLLNNQPEDINEAWGIGLRGGVGDLYGSMAVMNTFLSPPSPLIS
jgi:diadenosine tetraphosphatase ApaH/serine/threonine PP2A family protein phosphatase